MRAYSEICCKCKDTRSVARNITITFRGLKFKMSKPVDFCCHCYKKFVIIGLKKFEEEGYFLISKGQVIIDWNRCEQAYKCSLSGDDQTWDCIVIRLIDLGVLSRNRVSAMLSSRYMFKQKNSPAVFTSPGGLYFVTSEYARDYLEQLGEADNYFVIKYDDELNN